MDVKIHAEDQNVVNEHFRQIDFEIGDLDNNIQAADNCMEKYQPVRFLQLIVDCMSMVLGKKKVARL